MSSELDQTKSRGYILNGWVFRHRIIHPVLAHSWTSNSGGHYFLLSQHAGITNGVGGGRVGQELQRAYTDATAMRTAKPSSERVTQRTARMQQDKHQTGCGNSVQMRAGCDIRWVVSSPHAHQKAGDTYPTCRSTPNTNTWPRLYLPPHQLQSLPVYTTSYFSWDF